jgi:hypothetical protein
MAGVVRSHRQIRWRDVGGSGRGVGDRTGGDGSHRSGRMGGEDDMGAVMGVVWRCTVAQHERESEERKGERVCQLTSEARC